MCSTCSIFACQLLPSLRLNGLRSTVLTCLLPRCFLGCPFVCCRQLFEYDQVMNTQRDKVYGERRRALLAEDLSPLMIAERTVDDILEVRV